MRSVECQLVDARASDRPVSLVTTLCSAIVPLVGDLSLAERYLKALMDLSAKHAQERWGVLGRCFGGVLLIKRGDIGAGLELLRTALHSILAEVANALRRDR
jgi:hypothetical protein